MTLYQETLREIKPLLKTRVYSLYRANEEGHLGGRKVQELESLFCEYFGVRHAIAVSSATAGLHAAILACNLQGRPIVTTPVTFSATASAILMAGGKLIFKDIEAITYGLAPCKAMLVLPVHLHGHPADLDTIKSLFMIEDASQSLGAIYNGKKVGTLGKVGVFSFNQSKQISSGEGGMVITNNDLVAYEVKLLRNHGETQDHMLGYNYRLTELQAAILIPQFKKLEQTIADAIELCEAVSKELPDIPDLVPPIVKPDCRHVYCTYPIRVKGMSRDDLQDRLREKGIYFGNGGYTPLYHFDFYKNYKGNFPVAEQCYQEVMFTNIFRPPMKVKEAKRIAGIIKDCYGRIKKHT